MQRLDKETLLKADKEVAYYKWHTKQFSCRKCGNTTYTSGTNSYSRRCTKCKTIDSPTAATAFNKLHIPLPITLYLTKAAINSSKRVKSNLLIEDIHKQFNYSIRWEACFKFLSRIYSNVGQEPYNAKSISTIVSFEFGTKGILLIYYSDATYGSFVFSEKSLRFIIRLIKPLDPTGIVPIYGAELAKGKTILTPLLIQEQKSKSILNKLENTHSELMEWINGIHNSQKENDSIQRHLDFFIFKKNGGSYPLLMKLLTATG